MYLIKIGKIIAKYITKRSSSYRHNKSHSIYQNYESIDIVISDKI